MKKTITTAALATFSLADFPSGERVKLESKIIENALALWRKKQQAHLTALKVILHARRKPAAC
jgi:hypothetical protein